MSTTVYAEHYYGTCPPWILDEARARLADLYLLCEPDLPWEADGIRDSPTERLQLHSAFRDRLRSWGARVRDGGGERGGAPRLRARRAARFPLPPWLNATRVTERLHVAGVTTAVHVAERDADEQVPIVRRARRDLCRAGGCPR